MNKERFNALLADIDQITDNDIKSLNLLRKQYPYFQNQYVMIAKALKERDHPKADAFVKKAAIYVADRALLKGIVTGTHSFEAPAVEEKKPEPVATLVIEQKPEPTPTPNPTLVPEKTTAVTEEPAKEVNVPEAVVLPATPPPTKEEVKEHIVPVSEDKTVTKEPVPTVKQEVVHTKPAITAPIEEKTISAETKPVPISEDQQMLNELERDLKEIREKKRLIAKMLEQSDEKAAKALQPEKKSQKPRKKNQSELIEKFIQNEPQMEKQKLLGDDNVQHVDLASKGLRGTEEFHTETLAELLVNQKKYKRAIQIYEKLGLKFPEKRTYFASQIEKVNNKINV